MKSKNNIQFLMQIEKKMHSRRIPSARVEAEAIVRHCARLNRLDLLTGDKAVPPAARISARRLLRDRLRGTPLAHLLGESDFFGRSFFVSRHTLIPRPETELLLEEAGKVCELHFKGKRPQILDIGTGSGCIAVSLTIERPECRMTALDISAKALKTAERNVRRYGLQRRIRLLRSDLFGAFGSRKKAFWDIAISNPPYIAREEMPDLPKEVLREPRLALDGGEKGFEVIDAILDKAPYYLKPGGWLLMEIGHGQAEALGRRLKANKFFGQFRFTQDFNGIDRILTAQTIHG